jgi:uncharacterized protein GlcG (DUF336 family)
MSYHFKLDHLDEVIECVFEGIVSFEERYQAIEEGVTILQDREYPKILINLVAARMRVTRVEKKRLAAFTAEQHALVKAITAFLIRCEQTERAEVDSAASRSEQFVSQVFYSRTKAMSWLLNQLGDSLYEK